MEGRVEDAGINECYPVVARHPHSPPPRWEHRGGGVGVHLGRWGCRDVARGRLPWEPNFLETLFSASSSVADSVSLGHQAGIQMELNIKACTSEIFIYRKSGHDLIGLGGGRLQFIPLMESPAAFENILTKTSTRETCFCSHGPRAECTPVRQPPSHGAEHTWGKPTKEVGTTMPSGGWGRAGRRRGL